MMFTSAGKPLKAADRTDHKFVQAQREAWQHRCPLLADCDISLCSILTTAFCFVLFFVYISPSVSSLRPLDVEFMRRLSKVVNIVPVIAKADTLTLEERDFFKKKVGFPSFCPHLPFYFFQGFFF